MTETVRTDAGSGTSAVVSGVGTGFAAVTMAALVVPIRRGVEAPSVWAGAAFAIVCVLAFLASRRTGIDRRIVSAVAAVSSAVVVIVSAYALNQGITASVPLPIGSWSLSLVFVAFFTAGLTAGIGVAQFVGIDGGGLKDRSLHTTSLTVLGLGGLVAAQVATALVALPLMLVIGTLSLTQLVVVSQLGMALGTGAVAIGYLVYRGDGLSYLDLEMPTVRDALWIVAGVFVLFGALMAISAVFYTVGVESSEHGTAQQAQTNPEILLVLIPASLLIIGPFEELLYRNVIQKSLYETFSRYGAVVVGSVVFAIVHVLAYGTAGPGEVIASLGVIFGLSLVLGTIYERTENLVVPAVIHGIYNAILFTNLYAMYA
ncbi:CPBP family intramembrane metalloprotease [Natrarchaeobius halalkaliphilus]|uniref:CPBP family intramembrane metalloprotease n=1 Tax=Natrarchaeobius halalkaliphilus TaxID=1679091 RepID=A0A3N6LVF7_9EURY|nr:type II CAAX endopeptidase family protein [Natrarchaeobius halalkaliphilus]RQG91674.1 CPBP family intramembrane metalloprotease [Natrarchaeobius halalkaliphilus]